MEVTLPFATPRGAPAVALLLLLASARAAAPEGAAAAPPAEVRVVEYLKAHVAPGQPVVVSRLYNEVFTAPAERAALDRLFNTFFKIPLFAAQQQKATGRPPKVFEIQEQFHFLVPGQADLMLRIMASDPRMPRFLTRDEETGEITRVDVDAVLAHPRFGKALERTITGWEGRPAPGFETTTDAGAPLRSSDLAGTPYLLYFWFTGCPPCLRTSPLLAELDRTYGPRGFRIVGLNADAALALPYTAEERRAHAARQALSFALGQATPAMLDAYGSVSVFPTMFVVDASGTIVRHLVNFHEKAVLEDAIRQVLP